MEVSRRSILGSLAALPLLGGSVAGAKPIPQGAADARLRVIADDMIALQAEVEAFIGDDDGFDILNGGFGPLMEEMEGTPADTLAGVLHKIRAIDVPGVGDDGQAHDVMCSVCEDVVRLHAAGAISGVALV